MPRPRGSKKKDKQDEEGTAPEHVASEPAEGGLSTTKSPAQKGKKRKTATPKTASPKKKAKAAAAALALFSDIEAVGDLPEIDNPAAPTESEAPHIEAAPSPMRKKDGTDNLDAETPDSSTAVASTSRRTLSAELRKGTATIPFVVSNQMAISGDIPTAVRSLSSLEAAGKSGEELGTNSVPARVMSIRPRGEILADQCSKVFECHHCRRVYFNVYSLRMHIRQQHTNTGRKIRCPHCKFVFFKLSGLRDHLARGRCEKVKAKQEEKKKESEKEKEKEKKKEAKGEEGEESEEQEQSESSCDEESTDVPDRSDEKVARMNVHVAKMIFEPLLQRAMCIVEEKDETKQTKAGSRKRPVAPTATVYKCEMCSRSYEQRDSLRRHYKQVHIYLTPEQLKAKMKALKPPQVVYRCFVPDCKKVCPSKKQFKIHYKQAHPALFNELVEQQIREMDDSVLYECPTCGKSYFLEASYLKHREECGDIEEDDGYEIDIDYDLLNEPWVEPKEDMPGRGRRGKNMQREPLPDSDSAPDTQCRYCGKLFFTIYGRIDHERKHARGEVPEPSKPAPPPQEQQDEPTAEESRDTETPPIKVEGPISIRCMDCNKMFHSFDALERHHSSVHSAKSSSLLRSQLKA